MTTETDRDRLDTLLDASAPEVPVASAALRAEAMSMIGASEHGDRHERARRRRLPRAAIAGITVGSLLGFGGLSAAAATFDQWSWWAEEPDAAISFTLPSGQACEFRVSSAVGGMDPDAADAARDWASSVDLRDVVDIDQAIGALRAGDHLQVQDDGTEIVGGYGTDYYFTPDREYHQAVTMALGNALSDELVRQGFDGDVDYVGETVCPGYEW